MQGARVDRILKYVALALFVFSLFCGVFVQNHSAFCENFLSWNPVQLFFSFLYYYFILFFCFCFCFSPFFQWVLQNLLSFVQGRALRLCTLFSFAQWKICFLPLEQILNAALMGEEGQVWSSEFGQFTSAPALQCPSRLHISPVGVACGADFTLGGVVSLYYRPQVHGKLVSAVSEIFHKIRDPRLRN